MIDISIIIPVFNVEKYLFRCLNSIFNQEFSGTFEVIAVDDKSTDNSLRMLYDYQRIEKRLRVIEHESNKKLSIARSTGMSVAKGTYIMHIDSDDWILPNTLESLFKKCIQTGADILVFNFESSNIKGKRSVNNNNYLTQEIFTVDKLRVQKYFLGTTVNKIVKKELTLEMISGEIGINTTEDLLYSTEILLRAKTIYTLPETYYIYFSNFESITQTVDPNHLLQNQIIILNQINRIICMYQAKTDFVDNILTYLSNSLLFVIFHAGFSMNEKILFNANLIEAFSQFPQFDKKCLRILSSALRNKYCSILPVYKHFGIKYILYTFLKGLKIKLQKFT